MAVVVHETVIGFGWGECTLIKIKSGNKVIYQHRTFKENDKYGDTGANLQKTEYLQLTN